MANTTQKKSKETFISRSLRIFKENLRKTYKVTNQWRRGVNKEIEDFIDSIKDWEKENALALIGFISIVIFVGLFILFLSDLSKGKFSGGTGKGLTGAVIGTTIVSGIISPLSAGVVYLLLILLNYAAKLLTPLLMVVPLILWIVLYGCFQALIVLCKLLMLIPLSFLVIGTRLVYLWHRIRTVCPVRECSYSGLPDYVCPNCGTANKKLWPNLYGLLKHYCVNCDHLLPTMDINGRKKLERKCGSCGLPLQGKHAGKAPVQLIGIAGDHNSGKTCYLISTVGELLKPSSNGHKKVHIEIDDPQQHNEFLTFYQRFKNGVLPSSTIEVTSAFLLYLKSRRSKYQIYLYDAPGEEFTSIKNMSKQQHFDLLSGLIILVDPMSFKSNGLSSSNRTANSLETQRIITTLIRMTDAWTKDAEGKISKIAVAVVISKADLDWVKKEIACSDNGSITSDSIRAALLEWGGANIINALENRFSSLNYFACSSLGHEMNTLNQKPIEPVGVTEPMFWILDSTNGK